MDHLVPWAGPAGFDLVVARCVVALAAPQSSNQVAVDRQRPYVVASVDIKMSLILI